LSSRPLHIDEVPRHHDALDSCFRLRAMLMSELKRTTAA
jgi:hypothetical protein